MKKGARKDSGRKVALITLLTDSIDAYTSEELGNCIEKAIRKSKWFLGKIKIFH